MDISLNNVNHMITIHESLSEECARLTGPLVEPVEHGVVPLDAVLVVEDPVVLHREVEELGGDALALKGSEGSEAVGNFKTIVLLTVDDQVGGLPVGHERRRIPLLVQRHVLPRCLERSEPESE